MQFQVPQFIETEDKIIGPLTLRQFIYLGLTSLILFGLFFLLQTWLWFLVAVILSALAVSLAFVKVNTRPMSVFLINFAEFVWSPHSYTLETETIEVKVVEPAPTPRPATIALPVPPSITPAPTPRSSAPISIPQSKPEGLKDLWHKLLTTKTAIPKREKALPMSPNLLEKRPENRYEVIRKITGETETAKRVDY